MKYIITGSLGNISKPIAEKLVSGDHDVTVISSNQNKKGGIESLGAKAAIGSVEDRDFLKNTFTGADAIYLMSPPNFVVSDYRAFQKEIADNYVYAVKESKVKNIVLLSSIGAHLRKGAGPIDGIGYLEEQLEKLKDLNVKMLRPAYFYYNLLGMIGMIKQAGIMGSNFGAVENFSLVHPKDIAVVAAKHLLNLDFKGYSAEYIVSDERPMAEVAKVLGKAINKPELPWLVFSDEDALQGLLQAGFNKNMAEAYVEMGKAFREGRAQEDYLKSKTPLSGKIKLEEFAQEFAQVYNQ